MESTHTKNENAVSDSEPVSHNEPGQRTDRKGFLYSSVFLRVAASVVFIPCFIVITNTGGYHYLLLIMLLVAVAMGEFYTMMEFKGTRPYKAIGILCGVALSYYVFLADGMYSNLFLTLAVLTLMGMELTRRGTNLAVYHISVTILGVIYVAFLGSHLVLLRELPLALNLDYNMGASFVFLAFIITWAGDTGAYIVGSTLGKHRLIPRVSEKKTKEGSVGGLLFSVVAALIARATVAPYLDLWHALFLGFLAGIVGQLGDLFESMIKRDAAVKNTSDLLPGHGGVLDRFDSLLFTSPVIYYFLKFVIFK
ncbi:MAG: phosphatidate cytidylyltransferase [bacterium]|nr:phosphatidate cytidylyltransferase [bacterium]